VKITLRFAVVALLLGALLLPASFSAAQSGSAGKAAPSATGNFPRAGSRAEWEAYRSAAALSDPAKLEERATDFAQKFPASQLRAYLFQRAMGLYERANNSAKSLEMARDVLKYDPENPAALVTAALILANGARDSDLDRDARLEEAHVDALNALRSIGKLDESSGLSAEQVGDLSGQLSGAAHEALGTVAFKRLDFPTALKEYFIAATQQKQNADPVIWLRMSVAYEKTGNLAMSAQAAERAIRAAPSGSRVRALAEKQKAYVQKKSAANPAGENDSPPATAAPAGASAKN
jgi:hypothetical protein